MPILAIDQDKNPSKIKFLPDLAKFRFNQKFDFEVVSGGQLEEVHEQIQDI